jgi:hypothetical protein
MSETADTGLTREYLEIVARQKINEVIEIVVPEKRRTAAVQKRRIDRAVEYMQRTCKSAEDVQEVRVWTTARGKDKEYDDGRFLLGYTHKSHAFPVAYVLWICRHSDLAKYLMRVRDTLEKTLKD